ncbi:sensor histidine kinase [Faecalicatena contorta]|nr:sensor histidine kinase [Faecalicatena contorta]
MSFWNIQMRTGGKQNMAQKLIEKIRLWAKKLKIRSKFFIAYVSTMLLLILLLGGVFQYISVQVIFRNTASFTGEFLEQLSYNLENRTESLLETTYELMTDEAFLECIRAPEPQIKQEGTGKYRQNIRTLGNKHFSSSVPVTAFYVKGVGEQPAWWARYTKAFNDSNINQERAAEILEMAENRMGAKNTCWFLEEEENQVYLVRNMIDTKNQLGQVYGTVVFAIAQDFFRPIQSRNRMIDNESLVFENNESSMIYGDFQMEDGIDNRMSRKEDRYGNYISRILYQNESYIFAERIKNSTEWNIYCLIPEHVFMANAKSIKWYIMMIAVGAILVSLIFSYAVSRNLSRNIHYLERNMRKVEQGDFKVHIEPTSLDEIGMLCTRFNYMADKIEELIEAAYKEGQAKQRLKLQVLKAQINPHFLYNSLGSIQCMAKMEKQEHIAEMTAALIELLRASLSKNGEYHTVREEVEYIRNYFTLQKFRYEDKFAVEYCLCEGVQEYIMLDFILQPLVENAIFHGIEISKGNGIIRITSSVSEGKLRLTVEDNGVGMTQEKIKSILTVQEERYEGLNSIGVANVSQRIKQYFGEEYGLNYISEPGRGSIVEVWLPLFRTREEAQAGV